MSVTFTKLFSSITSSTIWVEDPETKVVWITMLAMADRRGRVFASIPGLAKDAVVSVDATRRAIASFLAPDPDSRTKDYEGRRIEEIDGGWRLLNHAKYRAIRDEEERRAYKTEKQRQYRALGKTEDECGQCGQMLNAVDSGGHNAEAEAYTEADIKTNTFALSNKPLKKKIPDSQVEEIYVAYPRHVGKAAATKAIRGALQRLSESGKDFAWLLGCVESYARSPAGQKPIGDDFRPHPSTWFNQARYFDDPQEWQKSKSNGVNGNGYHKSKGELALEEALKTLDHESAG